MVENEKKTPIGDPDRRLRFLYLILTYRCTSECSHCFASSSTRKDDPMKLSEVQEYLKEAKKLGTRWVWLFGGEPFLYFDLLLGAIESAKDLGFSMWTTSNAFWATSEEEALRWLRPLKEKRLDSIQFSADPFHWEYVPLEYVRNAVQAAEKLNINYSISNCYFLGKDDNSVLRLSQEITTRMSRHRFFISPINFQGTGAEVLAEQAPKQPWTRYKKCNYGPCGVGRGVAQLGIVNIDPYGYVQPCPGISIGNAKERKLSEIIRTYDFGENPIMKVLYEEGPVGPAKMAMKYGFKPTEYADECHLCYEARKVLLKHYPQYLAPAIWYERAK
jgi:MoaA/NifB/PqqE/SkfB family radical SAM enzyme